MLGNVCGMRSSARRQQPAMAKAHRYLCDTVVTKTQQHSVSLVSCCVSGHELCVAISWHSTLPASQHALDGGTRHH